MTTSHPHQADQAGHASRTDRSGETIQPNQPNQSFQADQSGQADQTGQADRSGHPDPADWLELNRAVWDERVPIHTSSQFYGLPGFLAGAESLRPFELAEVGDVSGRSLLHLQCHFGQDTLGWARHGATVTGLDFSAAAVRAAGELAGAAGISDARFVAANVYDAAQVLAGETFDIVYTGLGALCWLPDIAGWARTAASLVAPGGFLYLAEFHPFADVLGDDARTVVTDYFHRDGTVWDEPGTYTDSDVETRNTVTVEWQHGLGEVLSAIAAAGLRIEFVHEHDFTLFERFPVLEPDTDGITRLYRLPQGQPRVPLVYSVRAARPS
ncbi:class I SAM-dependent methyltransferase [Streptacidiphilus sp. 4-A2]|nr:class I SAM-dependent methyltransferase [Streptacidiphilus sp. 4-A2]